MNTSAIRHHNSHRPRPVRQAVVLRCKSTDDRSPLQPKVMGIRFDIGHLSNVIVRQIGLIVRSIGRVPTQIPIVRRLF